MCTDVAYLNLHLKNRAETALFNSCQLVDVAKKDLNDYWKAMAFTSDKWNAKKMESIESRTTADDFIECAR